VEYPDAGYVTLVCDNLNTHHKASVYGAFDAATADRLDRFILSAGGSEDAETLYMKFRGRMPGVEPLLRGRGLLDAA